MVPKDPDCHFVPSNARVAAGRRDGQKIASVGVGGLKIWPARTACAGFMAETGIMAHAVRIGHNPTRARTKLCAMMDRRLSGGFPGQWHDLCHVTAARCALRVGRHRAKEVIRPKSGLSGTVFAPFATDPQAPLRKGGQEDARHQKVKSGEDGRGKSGP